MNAWRWDGDDLLLTLHVQPGAVRSELAGLHGTALKVRVAAPPAAGRANRELLAFVARLFAVARNRVRLEQGASGRSKRVRVVAPGGLPAELAAALGASVATALGAD
ncbi:MAG TPA: DUF167 family protein [Gammaproteobacteria bacterium]